MLINTKRCRQKWNYTKIREHEMIRENARVNALKWICPTPPHISLLYFTPFHVCTRADLCTQCWSVRQKNKSQFHSNHNLRGPQISNSFCYCNKKTCRPTPHPHPIDNSCHPHPHSFSLNYTYCTPSSCIIVSLCFLYLQFTWENISLVTAEEAFHKGPWLF